MPLHRSVLFRSGGRAVRRVVAGAAALVLALSLAAPVQAAPGGDHGASLSSVWARIQSWFDGLLPADPATPSEDDPVPAFLSEGCEMDPAGSTCEEAEADSPIVFNEPDSEPGTQ